MIKSPIFRRPEPAADPSVAALEENKEEEEQEEEKKKKKEEKKLGTIGRENRRKEKRIKKKRALDSHFCGCQDRITARRTAREGFRKKEERKKKNGKEKKRRRFFHQSEFSEFEVFPKMDKVFFRFDSTLTIKENTP